MARTFSLFVVLLATALVAGCTATSDAPSKPGTPLYGPDVIHLDGLRNIEFGATEQELTQRGVLRPESASCGPQLADLSTVSPVFDEEKLVLLWVSPPMHTPEGITTGTPVDQVRDAFPAATALTAPQGTYRFDGLLARHGDRAYLFLHDGETVQKTIVGYADYAQKLFDEGFGTC